MSPLRQLRMYHAALAVLVVAAFLSGEAGIVHAWLGYGVGAVILVRLLLALTGMPQLGLMRFYPHFEGLRLDNALTHPAISRFLLAAIALAVVGVTATGIAMDQGRALGVRAAPSAQSRAVPAIVYAEEDDEHGRERKGEREHDGEEGPLGELHEGLANILMALVGAHVSYLLLFKRPLALFMLFLGGAKPSPGAPKP